jgi:hypothetical protein
MPAKALSLGNVRTPIAMPASPLKILSVIPPMTQLNTPYPSTAYLTVFLRSRGAAEGSAGRKSLASRGDLNTPRVDLVFAALHRSKSALAATRR